jgi:transcription initiation factor TFIIE subunit alpha
MHSAKYEDSFVKIANLIGGEEYLKVARALLNTEDATDEEIASATGLRINIIRKVLYDKSKRRKEGLVRIQVACKTRSG